MAHTASTFTNIAASVSARRSKWDMPASTFTAFNAGYLVPIRCIPCLPGDHLILDQHIECRETTLIHPVMDRAYVDCHWFFVPWRLVFDDYQKFFGYSESPWEESYETVLPHIDCSSGFSELSVADYIGIPPGVTYSQIGSNENRKTINHLQFRSYAKIWNDWWRSEVTQPAVDIPTDGVTDEIAHVGGDPYLTAVFGGDLLPVNKLHDMFTSGTPEPQKGAEIHLPLALSGQTPPFVLSSPYSTGNLFAKTDGSVIFQADAGSPMMNEGELTLDNEFLSSLTGPTVNALRQSIALQQILESDSRQGSRYVEYCRAAFGVTVPDFRSNRSEYVGGRTIRLGVNQVVQTSSTDGVSPQANLAAYSATFDNSSPMTYAALEHGYLICVACVRNKNSYQNGLERQFTVRRRFDIYDPRLANIGDVPVRNDQIFMSGSVLLDEETFNYNEAWLEYRYLPDMVTGPMRSGYSGGSLDVWHYADDYSTTPTFGDAWLRSSPTNIDRTIAVSHELEPQFRFLLEMRFQKTSCMPLYSIPGGLTHF